MKKILMNVLRDEVLKGYRQQLVPKEELID